MNPIEQIAALRIIPVVIIDDADAAEPLASALIEGGLPCAEVTFRTPAAAAAMTKIAKTYPSLLLGAGTVLNAGQVDRAIDAGARFIVSPGINPSVVEHCAKRGILITPGIVTPTEIETAIECGLETVKFFPAEACGGLRYLQAIAAPYGSMNFIPTGGIDESNVGGYLDFPRVLACGGSWMVKPSLIKTRDFTSIASLTASAVAAAKRRGADLKTAKQPLPPVFSS